MKRKRHQQVETHWRDMWLHSIATHCIATHCNTLPSNTSRHRCAGSGGDTHMYRERERESERGRGREREGNSHRYTKTRGCVRDVRHT